MRRPDPAKGDGPNWRGVVLFLVSASVLLLAFYAHQNQNAASVRDLTFSEFEGYLKEGKVKERVPFGDRGYQVNSRNQSLPVL